MRIIPAGNMRKIYILFAILYTFWPTAYAKGFAKSDCLEKEKALTLLETAENFLSKATESYPSCSESLNSTNQSECDSQKSLAYIEISKKLISDVRENFPSCSKFVVDDNKNETKDDLKDQKFRDCSEILASGHNKSGVYTIWPQELSKTGKPLNVYCDMETQDGGWTVIQRRGKYPVQQDFNLDWENYKNGFGNLSQEFWLGNENIRILCQKGCKIRFDLEDQRGEKRFALFQKFNLTDDNYRLEVSDYQGTAGHSIIYHNQFEFSTKDRDTSGKAKEYQSGWWHGVNYHCNLNGVYKTGVSGQQYVYWYGFRSYENLAAVEMKVKSN